MSKGFSAELDTYVRQARLPLRRIATRADIPHQTLFNWLNGTQPRWHPGLPGDLRRLALALGLDGQETDQLLQSAGCLPAHAMARHTKEAAMDRSRVLPRHWVAAGSHPADYDMGVETGSDGGTERYAFVRSGDRADGFGTLMQVFAADAYNGKRIRFSARVRTTDVEQWAALWMRVDGSVYGEMLAFDNMQNRPITGTADWERYAVVLDVARAAKQVAFGVLLAGSGEVRVTGIELGEVGKDVATTDEQLYPPAPMNLSLAEG